MISFARPSGFRLREHVRRGQASYPAACWGNHEEIPTWSCGSYGRGVYGYHWKHKFVFLHNIPTLGVLVPPNNHTGEGKSSTN